MSNSIFLDYHSFSDLVDDVFLGPSRSLKSNPFAYSNSLSRTNVKMTETDIVFQVCFPGVLKEDFHIGVTEGEEVTLTIEYKGDKGQNPFIPAKFRRVWRLPDNTNTSKVNARYEQGVFEVFVPKTEPVEPRTKIINVK